MAKSNVNQPPAKVPQPFSRDPALNDYFSQVNRVLFQLWQALGGGSSGEGGIGTIEFRIFSGSLQYRTSDTGPWIDLISMSSLQGKDGKPGKDGAPGEDADTTSTAGLIAASLQLCDELGSVMTVADLQSSARFGVLRSLIDELESLISAIEVHTFARFGALQYAIDNLAESSITELVYNRIDTDGDARITGDGHLRITD